MMKNRSILRFQAITFVALTFFGSSLATYADIEFSGGISAEIDYLVDGSVWIYDANVIMVGPAHIQGAVVTCSEAVLDVYGGQIDSMLLISTNNLSLPEGIVTVYGTDFAVDGVPVDPNTTELFMQYQTLSGVYESGSAFAFPVDCVIAGGGGFLYYQTVKLGWLFSEPDIELSRTDYNFEQVDIGANKAGTLSIFNLGNASLTIQSLQLEQSQAQFEFTPWQTLPVTVEPNSVIDLEIAFNPVTEGIDTAVLSIASDDPNDPMVDVILTGEAMAVVRSPEEQITRVLDDYNTAVDGNMIEGVGNKSSEKAKLRLFGKMLVICKELIDAGYDDHALEVLAMIEEKCDGQKNDFIKGESVEALNIQINKLIEMLRQ